MFDTSTGLIILPSTGNYILPDHGIEVKLLLCYMSQLQTPKWDSKIK